MTSLHILLVDDSEADIFLHKLVIDDVGCARVVDVASHGREALDLLEAAARGEREAPDAIFLDINMPVMNGWEFLDAATGSELLTDKTVVVTMLSTSNNPADRERAGRYGAVKAYTTKPLTSANLGAILRDTFPSWWPPAK